MSLRRPLFGFLVASFGGLVLAACSTSDTGFRETIGLDRAPPDEFLVVTKAPLVVPTDLSLRPPDPGALPRDSSDPRALARSTITGSTDAPIAGTSAGEQSILARAGVGGADPNIRADLRREQGIATRDQSLVDQLVTARRDNQEVLDPYAEQHRIRTDDVPGPIATGAPPITGSPTAPGAPTTILIEDILGGSASTN